MTKLNNRIFKLLGIIFVLTLIMSAFVAVLSKISSKNNAIYFYVNGIEYETSINVEDDYLLSLIKKVNPDKETDYKWSKSPTVYQPVNFDKLKNGDKIYLIPVTHIYEVKVHCDELANCIILQDDFTYQGTFEFLINSQEQYQVFANGIEIHSSNGTYKLIVENDIEVKVKVNYRATIVPNENIFKFDGTKKEFDYTFDSRINLNEEDVPLDIKYYQDPSYTQEVEPINPGTYYVVASYLGSDYLIDKVYSTLTIKKGETLTESITAGSGTAGLPLSTVALSGSFSGVEGTLRWVFPTIELTESGKFAYEFIPNDNRYESVQGEVYVLVKNELFVVQESVSDYISYIERNDWVQTGLPISTDLNEVHVDWISMDTLLSIEDGQIDFLTYAHEYEVEIIGVVRNGNAVEYIRFVSSVTYEENDTIEDISYEPQVIEPVEESFLVESVRECKPLITRREEKEANIVNVDLDGYYLKTDSTSKQEPIIKYIKYYNEDLISNFSNEVSEIIIWKVVSNKDKGSDRSILLNYNLLKQNNLRRII